MQTNFMGRVRNTSLSSSNGLMPVFEAIVNSMLAIKERGNEDGEITISIDRRPVLLSSRQGQNIGYSDILGFTVVDNGIGFTEENFTSFEILDSDARARFGGKGIGRVLYLKAFIRAEVSSFYCEGNLQKHRTFQFKRTKEGIEEKNFTETEIAGDPIFKTSVQLIAFEDKYRKHAPKSGRSIARRIVEHCLESFVLEQAPTMWVNDRYGDGDISLNEIYYNDIAPAIDTQKITVQGAEYTVRHVLRRKTAENSHQVLFCGNARVAKSFGLASRFTHLEDTIVDENSQPLVYNAYISGPVLDKAVNAARDGFDIDRRNSDTPSEDQLYWEDIEEKSVEAAGNFLEPFIKQVREQSLTRVVEFIAHKEIKYRPLLKYRRDDLAAISPNLSDDDLDLQLHSLLHQWRSSVRQAVRDEIEVTEVGEVEDGTELERVFHEQQHHIQEMMSELQDIASSDLAEYVAHRATIILYFDKILGQLDNGKFPDEEILHGIFFPMRKTSDEVCYDEHNLWLLDERLAYHQYLASDLRFVAHENSPVEVSSAKRPDLLIYDRIFAFAPGEGPQTSVTIFEFKKPERNDYKDEDNPIRQVFDYVSDIRGGKARKYDHSTVEPLPDTTPFYCYIVATLTPKLLKEVKDRGFTPMPDNRGHFWYNANLRAYIEVLSPRKVLDDAKKRNKAFFDRLQLGIR